ncbi:MAG TPA: ATP-binding cassette domain-containing protein [Bryobacteraceae bacterium]|nr:ATP-binding cassette domain-containing protein [Bryobacteraceae bacterium]
MRESNEEPVLAVEQLSVTYRNAGGDVPVLRNWCLRIAPGEAVGVMGPSGAGKTTFALALLGLLPPSAVVQGSACFEGVELIGAPEPTLQRIRGARIALIHQEPGLSLSPVMRAVDQVAEVLRAHGFQRGGEAKKQARSALEQAGLADETLQNAYPHQLSGGQRQRVVIAQAIVCRPSLLIADEPTSALDAVATVETLELLRGIVRSLNAALILISHDPHVLSFATDRVLMIQAGSITEACSQRAV